jgi:hypothetical protein
VRVASPHSFHLCLIDSSPTVSHGLMRPSLPWCRGNGGGVLCGLPGGDSLTRFALRGPAGSVASSLSLLQSRTLPIELIGPRIIALSCDAAMGVFIRQDYLSWKREFAHSTPPASDESSVELFKAAVGVFNAYIVAMSRLIGALID